MTEKLCRECGQVGDHRWNARCRKCENARTYARRGGAEERRACRRAEHIRALARNPHYNTEKSRKARERNPERDRARVIERAARIAEGSVSAAELRAIYERAGGKCAYCGEVVACRISGKRLRGFDHIVPFAKGGKHVADNLAVCCRQCNSKKRDELWEPKFMVAA